ncbi:hypothetical protein ACQ4PT_010466 [Festuca glaucescens]
MVHGNGSSSSSTAGKLQGHLSGGAGGGDKPPRHPRGIKSLHEFDGLVPAIAGAGRVSERLDVLTLSAGGQQWEAFQCSFCKGIFIVEEELKCHIRLCHVPRSWRRARRAKGEAPLPPRSVRQKLSLGGQGSSSSHTENGGSSPEQQQTDEPAAEEAPASRPVIDFAFDLNVLAPEVAEEEKGSSG